MNKICVFFGIFNTALGLLEKEAGHYDWKLPLIGAPSVIASFSIEHVSALIGTVDGYIGKIRAKDGTLLWRTLACPSNLAVYSIAFSSDLKLVQVQCSDSATTTFDSGSGSFAPAGDSYFSEYHYRASPITVNAVTISVTTGDVIVGKVNDVILWSREESLSSSTSSVIASISRPLPLSRQSKDLSWLIGDTRPILLSFSSTAHRIVAVDLSAATVLWGKQVESEITSLSNSPSDGVSLIDSSGSSLGTIDPLTGSIKYLRTQSSDESGTTTYTVSGNRVYSKSWSVQLSGEILKVVDPVHSDLGSVPVLVKGDATVVFKYMNPNLVVLVSEGIYITALDTVTGYIVYQTVLESANANAPIHVVLCDNWIVAHYHSISGRFEVISIDLFEKKEDKGIMPIITGQDLRSHKSAFDLPTDPIGILQQYIFPAGPVTALAVTATTQGVTPRQVLFATNRGILAIRKDTWLNPRREGTDTKIHPRLVLSGEESLPPYSHTLPLIWTDLVSHKHVLNDVKQIKTFPTHLESVSVAVSLGRDIFVTPVYMGNAPYDVLSPFFNFWLLYVSVTIVVVAVSVTSVLAKQTDLNNNWK